jgi:hypothetical protein
MAYSDTECYVTTPEAMKQISGRFISKSKTKTGAGRRGASLGKSENQHDGI